MLTDISAQGVRRCPCCDKPMLIVARGYICANCLGFVRLDIDTAPLEDVGIHQRFVLRERIHAEEKVADAQQKVAHWRGREAAIQARLEHERQEGGAG